MDGLNEEDWTMVVVGEGWTVCPTLTDEDVPKLESPLYTAVTLRDPCVTKAPLHAGKMPPDAGVVVQSATLGLVVVSKKVTVPLGKVRPVSVTRDATVAVKVAC